MERLSVLVAGQSTIGEIGAEPDLRCAELGWQAVVHGAEVIAADRFGWVR